MAPLPPIWDPAKAADRLPQPFRMIDKILGEVIETALEICVAKDRQKYVKRMTHIDTVISPHALIIASGQASCITAVGVAGMVVVGTTTGEINSHTARDPNSVGQDKPHASMVTAMDIGHVSATGTKVVLSVSQRTVAVHEVAIRSVSVRRLAVVDLPLDPGLPPGEAPCTVSFSSNAGHAAVCWPSGPVAVYEVTLPKYYYTAATGDAPLAEPTPEMLVGGQLRLVLHFSIAVIKSLLVGNSMLGACHIVWQQQQRPDKSGKSDRNHKPARGIYMWWTDCNKLALSYLDHLGEGAEASAQPKDPAPPTAPSPPPTPSKAVKGKAPVPAKGGKGGAATPVEEPAAPAAPSGPPVRTAPSKGWLLPLGITSSCVSENGKTLAFGLNDGTILVWDDHFGGHTKILPRMPGAVSALAFVNGVANLLMACSVDGSVYLADVVRPEDSHISKTKLPHMATEVYFLPSDPFAICVCPGDAEQQPRLVWFNTQDEKLTAELSGRNAKPDNLGFGRAGMALPSKEEEQAAAASAAAAGEAAAAAAAAAGASGQPPSPGAAGKPPPPAAAPPPTPPGTSQPPIPPAGPGPGPSGHLPGGNTEPGAALQLDAAARPWPVWCFRDSYLVLGGPTPVSSSYQPPTDGSPPVPEEELPREAHLYLYKIDAIARMMLPEEMASTASKSLLDRMLADLDPPKMQKKQVINKKDQGAGKPSALRKSGELPPGAGPEDSAENLGGRRHIKFNEADLEGLLNEEQGTGKLFKKETIKGGYSEGRSKQITDPVTGKPGLPPGMRKLDLSAYGGGQQQAQQNVPIYMQERPQSPPWHHTNPLARIHPDWEEAPVLARIMDKLGTKGGGRRRRDRRLTTVAGEMKNKLSKELAPDGSKPVLLFQP